MSETAPEKGTGVIYSNTYGDPNWMPPQLQEACATWIKAQGLGGEFLHGWFPLGLVQGLLERVKRVEAPASALRAAREAINPPDKDGISLHEWNQRLKAATAQIDAALSHTTDAERQSDGGL